jgi:hypothetical protein
MRGAQLAELTAGTPDGVDTALELVAGVDAALGNGFARLTGEHTAALTALAGSLAATPLGPCVGDAVDRVTAGSVTDAHLTVLAAARTAVLGSVHDALLSRVDTALGRARPEWDAPTAAVPDDASGPLAAGRSWLTEVALAGWRGVDHDLVSAAGQAVQALLAEPALRRPAVLLDGLVAELRACGPVSTMDRLPARRWGDLWARAMVLARPGALAAVPHTVVSGRLLVLGVDVHEHATAVQLQVHAVLEPTGGAASRLVRTSVSAAKVDTIVGPAVWQLFRAHPVLLGALAGHTALDVTDVTLFDGGDLVWREDRAGHGEPADPFAVARVRLPGASAAPVPPLDRHPVRIAEPVLLEGYTVRDGTIDLDGVPLAVDLDRLPACGPLTPELVAASQSCVGLLRWSGGWTLQPLAVQGVVRRRPVAAHTSDWALGPTDPRVVKAQAKAGDAVTVLRERAGRLLRR